MWDAFLQFIFDVLKWLYGLVSDWGIAILLLTLLIRLLLYPLSRKQYKGSYMMSKLQPKIAENRAKYAGDPQRMNEEQMKIYQEAKYNPLSGCLPALLQMPILMGLFFMLRSLASYVEAAVAEGQFSAGLNPTDYSFLGGFLPDITMSPGQIFAAGGFGAFIPYGALMLLFSVSMLVPILINKTKEKSQLIMFAVMSVFMLWVGWSVPAGVLIYWDASAYIGVIHQIGSRKILEAKDKRLAEEVVEIVPVKVEVERKTKKSRPKKSK